MVKETRGQTDRHFTIAALMTALIIFLLLAPAMAQAKSIKAANITFTVDSPYVSDNARILNADVSNSVYELNRSWEEKADGTQLAVVTVDSLPNSETIESYSTELFDHIKPGQKEKDNGLLYLIVKDTHQDRLEVGYGLESTVTDSKAADILNNAHASFKKNDYADGVKRVVNDLKHVVSGDSDTVTRMKETKTDILAQNVDGGSIAGWGAVILFIVWFGWRFCRAFRAGLRGEEDDDDFWSSGSSGSFHSSYHSSHHSSHNSGGFGGGRSGGGGASGSW